MGRIVIVNDEPNVLEVMMAVLEEDGHAVRGFAHGREALTALEEEMADLVITDCSNHPIDGVEFVHRLRGWSDVPVVFVSAWAQEIEENLRGTRLEAQNYVQLPFSAEELTTKVRVALLERPIGPRSE